MKTHGQQPSRRSGTTAAGGTIINIITGVIFFGLLALGVLWVMKTAGEAGQQYTTAMVNTQMRATDVTCQANLRTIGQNLEMYAISNERFPASQQELVDFCGTPRLFRCPDPNGGDYLYVPGRRGDMPADSVLVYESKPVHNGRCNVLFLGGQISSLTPEEIKQTLAALDVQSNK